MSLDGRRAPRIDRCRFKIYMAAAINRGACVFKVLPTVQCFGVARAPRPVLCDSQETDRHPPDVVFYAKKTAIGTPAAGDQHSECEKERSFGRYLDPLPG
jgi:hypothetical protein